MNTLLFRLAGPLQSWGVQSPGESRDTGLEPSKSGVIGLLCAALGRPRTAPLDDLVTLRMGVRVDCEGRVESDFQTIHTRGPDGASRGNPGISRRWYLSGAVFLVGLEGDELLLRHLQDALQHPFWLLYLGRKAFPPSLPIGLPDGFCEGQGLQEALQTYPWLLIPQEKLGDAHDEARKAPMPEKLRVVVEDPTGDHVRPDVPISFAERRFHSRRVRTGLIPFPQQLKA